jgi:hypothetical protein
MITDQLINTTTFTPYSHLTVHDNKGIRGKTPALEFDAA